MSWRGKRKSRVGLQPNRSTRTCLRNREGTRATLAGRTRLFLLNNTIQELHQTGVVHQGLTLMQHHAETLLPDTLVHYIDVSTRKSVRRARCPASSRAHATLDMYLTSTPRFVTSRAPVHDTLSHCIEMPLRKSAVRWSQHVCS
jgi:hypothetical protein